MESWFRMPSGFSQYEYDAHALVITSLYSYSLLLDRKYIHLEQCTASLPTSLTYISHLHLQYSSFYTNHNSRFLKTIRYQPPGSYFYCNVVTRPPDLLHSHSNFRLEYLPNLYSCDSVILSSDGQMSSQHMTLSRNAE